MNPPQTADFTLGNSGAAAITAPLAPRFIRFTVSQKFGVQENGVEHISIGTYDTVNNRNKVHSEFGTGYGHSTRKFNDRCISHWDNQGLPSELLSAAVTSVVGSIVNFNVIQGNAQFQVTGEFWP